MVEKAGRAIPVLVVLSSSSGTKAFYGGTRRNRARIPLLADDADKTILGYCARCPTLIYFCIDPISCALMVGVISVEQGYKDVDIEQSSTH